MTTPKQKQRRDRIEAAAYEVLIEKGYKAASMLDIAKRAGASNETLYRWYGNKQTLFASLVERNAKRAKERLQDSIATGGDPIEELRLLGPILLGMVTGEKAVALNRAAAGDFYQTGTLGPAIAKGGKQTIAPLIGALISDGIARGKLRGDASDIASTFIALLIADSQIARVIGVMPVPTDDELQAQTDHACTLISQLYGA